MKKVIIYLVMIAPVLAAHADGVNSPNRYECSGGSIHITYSTTGKSGAPSFSYQDDTTTKIISVSGASIQNLNSPIGKLVTVGTDYVADKSATTATLVLPQLGFPPNEKNMTFETSLIWTNTTLSKAGYEYIDGVATQNSYVTLQCIGRYVSF